MLIVRWTQGGYKILIWKLAQVSFSLILTFLFWSELMWSKLVFLALKYISQWLYQLDYISWTPGFEITYCSTPSFVNSFRRGQILDLKSYVLTFFFRIIALQCNVCLTFSKMVFSLNEDWNFTFTDQKYFKGKEIIYKVV